MKKFLALVMALCMILALCACGQQPAADAPAADAPAADAPAADAPAADDKDVPKIVYVAQVIGQAWWDYVRVGVEQWSKDTGYEVIYKGPTEVDAAAQIQILTDVISQGIDILCFSPVDPDACEPILKEAREKGIIVISTEATGMENIDFDVEAFDEAGMGGFLMKNLAEQMGEEGERPHGGLFNQLIGNHAKTAVEGTCRHALLLKHVAESPVGIGFVILTQSG